VREGVKVAVADEVWVGVREGMRVAVGERVRVGVRDGVKVGVIVGLGVKEGSRQIGAESLKPTWSRVLSNSS